MLFIKREVGEDERNKNGKNLSTSGNLNGRESVKMLGRRSSALYVCDRSVANVGEI